jgi:hypothetical protein
MNGALCGILSDTFKIVFANATAISANIAVVAASD